MGWVVSGGAVVIGRQAARWDARWGVSGWRKGRIGGSLSVSWSFCFLAIKRLRRRSRIPSVISVLLQGKRDVGSKWHGLVQVVLSVM